VQGAQLVFEKFIVPLLQKYGSTIDPVFATTEQVCALLGLKTTNMSVMAFVKVRHQ
jgi:hypothetical protein